ncbi:MAG: hypothetical protein U0T69_06185 [Chitinophagales bacterium]
MIFRYSICTIKNNKNKQMNQFLNPAFLLRLAIAIGYLFLGAALLFFPVSIAILNKTTRPLFALLLVAYGLFRLYRAFQILKEEE